MSDARRINAGINHDHNDRVDFGKGVIGTLGEINFGVVYKGDKIKTQAGLAQMLLDALYAYCVALELDPVAEVTRIHDAYTAHQAGIQMVETKAAKIIERAKSGLVDAQGTPIVAPLKLAPTPYTKSEAENGQSDV